MFDKTNKCYLYKLEIVPENFMHLILWDFDIQTSHLISARRPHVVFINKRKIICHLVDFFLSQGTTEWKWKKEKWDKYLDLIREHRKLWNIMVMLIPNMIGALGTFPKGLEKKTARYTNRRKSQDCTDHSIIKIGLNSQKSLGDWRF